MRVFHRLKNLRSRDPRSCLAPDRDVFGGDFAAIFFRAAPLLKDGLGLFGTFCVRLPEFHSVDLRNSPATCSHNRSIEKMRQFPRGISGGQLFSFQVISKCLSFLMFSSRNLLKCLHRQSLPVCRTFSRNNAIHFTRVPIIKINFHRAFSSLVLLFFLEIWCVTKFRIQHVRLFPLDFVGARFSCLFTNVYRKSPRLTQASGAACLFLTLCSN